LDKLIIGTGSRLSLEGMALYRQLIANPGHAAGALAMMANWDLHRLRADLPRMPAPLHLVTGTNDLIVPPRSAQAVAQLPGLQATTRVHNLAGLGHLAHEERPDLVARHVLGILPRV
jgi:magnesium chelatase accessory protein